MVYLGGGTSMLRKWSTVGIVLLFIGVAVAPSISPAVKKTSTGESFYEVTSQAYGINGFGNTTAKLTKQQCQDLEQYLIDFRARLNQTTTKKDVVPLFKDAVVELDKYGLLPKGMSVEQAFKLTTRYAMSPMTRNKSVSSRDSNGTSNIYCLIAGFSTLCLLSGIITTGLELLLNWYLHSHYFPPYGVPPFFALTLEVILISMLIVRNHIPLISTFLSLLSVLGVLTFGLSTPETVPIPAHGWLNSYGLLGPKKFFGFFYGTVPYPVINDQITAYTGAFGFTGLKILFPGTGYMSFFLGGALSVSINETPPNTGTLCNIQSNG
jgi:hypothetical protein